MPFRVASAYFRIIILILALASVIQPACAMSSNEARELKARANLATRKLNTAIEEGKDVSNIVPMMIRVKQLADNKKLHEADTLLSEVLLELEKLDETSADNQHVLNTVGVFNDPRKVNIIGYRYNAMEPFITRDGKFIFFNSDKTDTPETHKDIYYARRIDDTNFEFMGKIKGVNSSKVDGVPTMDRDGNFYYVSVVNYGRKNRYTTVYSGKFNNGHVTDIKPHPELSLNMPGWLNMDIEISADGNTLYATQTFFGSAPPPKKSYFFLARKIDNRFVIDENSNSIFELINTDDLEYAASITTDELEIFFTRLNIEQGFKFTTYHAKRPDKEAPFSEPKRIQAITGIAEAPAISNDGELMYYHKKEGRYFNLFVLTRKGN